MAYNIDFSDPLRTGFQIAAGSFDGPGGAVSSSTLRLYGRGALEWGEAVDEDLLRTLENFNGATPPPFPLGGQLWFQTKFYWLHDSTTWYLLDPDTPSSWTNIGPTGTNAVQGGVTGVNSPSVTSIGSYWYTGAGPLVPSVDAFQNLIKVNTLYLYDSAYQQQAPGWIERTNSVAPGAPTDGVDYPDRNLLVWDEFASEWVLPPTSFVTTTTPTNPTTGAFWWDLSNDQLKVWDGATWIGVILASGTVPMTGPLNMNNFNITNLPVLSFLEASSEDAATIRYVNEAVSSANLATTLDPLYLRKDGVGATMTGGFLTLFQDPTAAFHAATMGYVDTEITNLGIGTGGSAVAVYTGGAPTYKAGDIFTNGAIIWIAVAAGSGAPPGGSWKQVFPAQYS